MKKNRRIDPVRFATIALYDYQKEISGKFPINIRKLALTLSQYEEDPIVEIKPVEVSEFKAGLFYLKDSKGWVILYNPRVSKMRINFSIAHEVAHYFIHRKKQTSFECSLFEADFIDAEYMQQEKEADEFASALLLPNNEFLSFIKGEALSNELFIRCSEKYNISLTAVLLKWINNTFLEAALLVEKNNKVLWGRVSNASYSKGIFFKGNSEISAAKKQLNILGYSKSFLFGTEDSKIRMQIFLRNKR